MTSRYQPIFTFLICILTLCVSFYVAFDLTESIWGKSSIIYLADYGGLTLEGLKNGELWRLLTSQLIHVHQKHMIYNVLSLLFMGIILEGKIGYKYTAAIWLIAGALGTLFSIPFATAPWNIGTGASQAAFGFAGFLLVMALKPGNSLYITVLALLFALMPSLYLDVKSVGYPKAGHVLSFVIGFILALCFYKRHPIEQTEAREAPNH